MNNKGITLIALAMIIVLLGIIVLGIASYISQSLLYDVSQINQQKAYYMAQAGIMKVVVDYVNNGSWAKEQNTSLSGEFYYSVGEEANFLLLDTTNPQINSGDRLRRVPIKNINSTDSITITDMILEWDFGGNIEKVRLADDVVYNSSASSPANLNITDTAIDAGDEYDGNNDQQWEFSTDIPAGSTVVVTFIFDDGSSFKAYLLKDGDGVNNEFSIKATGIIQGGVYPVAKRTLVATYDVGTNLITSWEETQSHLP